MHPLAPLKARQQKASSPPLIHPPQFPESLPGTIFGIATYFNPASYRNRLANYRTFRAASKRQGLKLIVVEAAMEGKPFELADDDAEQVIRVRAGSVLWQKERLLSVAFAHLPPDCDKVVWIDTDILFMEDDWIAKTCALLERYMIVQPFAEVTLLPHYYQTRKKTGFSHGMGKTYHGTANRWATASSPQHFTYSGSPGAVVAARRRILEKCPLYDRMIMGGGDAVVMGAFMGVFPKDNITINSYPAPLLSDAHAWAENMASIVRGSVSFLPGRILHLWHGTERKRYYIERASILQPFDPRTDIRIDDNGCWTWATDKPALHEQVRHYFWARDEDGKNVPSFESLRIRELEKKISNQLAKKVWLEEMLNNERTKNVWLEGEMTKQSALAEEALADERRKSAWLEEMLRNECTKSAWLEETISSLRMQNTPKEESIPTSPSAQRQPAAAPLFAQRAESFFDRRIPRLLLRGSRRRTIVLRLLTWMMPS